MRLDLSQNRIGERGGVAIAHGLRRAPPSGAPPANAPPLAPSTSAAPTSLHTLRLSSNKLGEAAGEALGLSIAACASLRALYVQNNSLGARAGEALVRGVEANGSIGVVSVDGNSLPYSSDLRLQEALGANARRLRESRPSRVAAQLVSAVHAPGPPRPGHVPVVVVQLGARAQPMVVVGGDIGWARAPS